VTTAIAATVARNFAAQASCTAFTFGAFAGVASFDVDEVTSNGLTTGGAYATGAGEGLSSVLTEADGFNGWHIGNFAAAAGGIAGGHVLKITDTVSHVNDSVRLVT